MIEFVDSHTHLDAPEFDQDRDDVIARAHQAGVTRIVTIGAGYGRSSIERAVQFAELQSGVWATVGIHPQQSNEGTPLDLLREHAQHPRVVAIGETGLDFYRDWAPREVQEEIFRAQIAIALGVKKPLVIHSREAGEDCFRILDEMGAAAVGGVFHCFAENAQFAARLHKLNFLVSFPGAVTFKKADALRSTVQEIPLGQIMVETDAPYLAPEPHRGKRCESSFVPLTAARIAAVKGVSLESVAAATTENARRLFRLP